MTREQKIRDIAEMLGKSIRWGTTTSAEMVRAYGFEAKIKELTKCFTASEYLDYVEIFGWCKGTKCADYYIIQNSLDVIPLSAQELIQKVDLLNMATFCVDNDKDLYSEGIRLILDWSD